MHAFLGSAEYFASDTMSSTSQPELELEIMQAMRAEEQRRQLKRSGIAVKRDPAFVQSRKTIVIWIFEVVSFKNLREETCLSAIVSSNLFRTKHTRRLL